MFVTDTICKYWLYKIKVNLFESVLASEMNLIFLNDKQNSFTLLVISIVKCGIEYISEMNTY